MDNLNQPNQNNQAGQPAQPIQTASQQSKQMQNAGTTDNSIGTVSIQCCIRRKPSLVGLPGSDPKERMYKIGSSIDTVSKKSLKGVTGEVEKKYMPLIVGINSTDNDFQTRVNEYWANIGVFIPADDPNLKAEQQGKVINIKLTVKGGVLKNKIESETDIAKKIEFINDGISNNLITLAEDAVTDYILLCYCIKYSRVAKDISLLHMSPKIFFYIYNRTTATKVQLSSIEIRNKAINFFMKIKDNEDKVNQLLVMFNLLPTNYETLDDKIIALDEIYNKTQANMEKFANLENDSTLALKYLVIYATKKGKLHNPELTDAYYYNQVLLGKTLDDSVRFLADKSNTEAQQIRETLEREIKE